MYIMYVDESGDPGLARSPTRYFALSGITVHESDWRTFVDALVAFRRKISAAHGLPMRAEIHAAPYLRHPPAPNMPKHVRLTILRNLLDEMARMKFISITNVIVDKVGKPASYDVFENAWKVLFQRFENTMSYGNFPGAYRTDKGMIFVDNTNGKKLTSIVRKMTAYNPVPNRGGGGFRMLPAVRIVEDPHGKNSAESLCIQAADVVAYFLYQSAAPNAYVRKQGAGRYLGRLGNVLNRAASKSDPQGIVRL